MKNQREGVSVKGKAAGPPPRVATWLRPAGYVTSTARSIAACIMHACMDRPGIQGMQCMQCARVRQDNALLYYTLAAAS